MNNESNPIIKGLAHAIYWPLRILGNLIIIAAIIVFMIILWRALVWYWQNDKAIVSAVAFPTAIVAYIWAEAVLGKGDK